MKRIILTLSLIASISACQSTSEAAKGPTKPTLAVNPTTGHRALSKEQWRECKSQFIGDFIGLGLFSMAVASRSGEDCK